MVVTSPEQSVPQESRKKKTPDVGKIEKYSEMWEHAKNLESKIKKLKEHAIDTDEIREIEGILKDAKSYFSRFGEKKDKGKSVAQLEERRKAAVAKLANLNRRMVSMLEKLGQSIPDTLLSYKDAGLVDAVKKSNEEKEIEEKKEESSVVGADLIQPPENYSEGPLGGSEIGGVNSIAAPEEKEEALVSAEESLVNVQEESSSTETPIEDVIQISSGGKTYEFGWHEQVVYTTAKGKQLDCIVLGKSKDETKPGLILKDLEKGKVFALGADAVAKRVRVSDGEIVSPSVENNKADSGQSAEDDDIFGLRDQPKQEETQWPESREESMDEMIQSARAAIEDEEIKKIKVRKKEESKKIIEDEDIFGLKNQPKSEETKWSDNFYAPEKSIEGMIADAKVDVENEMNQQIEESRRKSKKEKYEAELQLPPVIVSDESLVEKPVPVQKGETNTPTRERVPQVSNDLPSIMVDKEFYKEQLALSAARERKTYPEVSEEQAIDMIAEVIQGFEKSWNGMHMVVKEKKKVGWFRSAEVERHMTNEEKKAQLEYWLDTAEQAVDSIDAKKSENLWKQAQAVIRALETELRLADETGQNEVLDRAFSTMNDEVGATRARLEEKQKKRNGGMLRSGIANWATRIMLGTIGGSFAAGSVETNRAREREVSAQMYSGEEEKKEYTLAENAGESQQNLLSFLMDVNKMMTESALSKTSFTVDSGLASEIKRGKEEKVPGLVGAEISSDGKSVTLTFDNKKTVESRPEKVHKAGGDSWKLKASEKKGPEYGEQVLKELRQVLGEVKQEFPGVFQGSESPSKQKRIVRTVLQAEKRLREAEAMIPRSGEARRQLDQVKQIMEEVKPGIESISKEIIEEIKAEDLELPQDVFVRFGVQTSQDAEAARLAEEWSRVDKSLKAAEKEGDQLKMRQHKTEIKKILEEIKSKY